MNHNKIKKSTFSLFFGLCIAILFGCDCPTSLDNFIQINLATREVSCINTEEDCFQSVPFNISIIRHEAPDLIRQGPNGNRQFYFSNIDGLDPLHSALDIFTFPGGGTGASHTIRCNEPPNGGGTRSRKLISSTFVNPPYPNVILFADGQEYTPFQPEGQDPVTFLSISFIELDF